MAPNVNTLLFKAPAGALTSRTLADHLGDVLNVKNFGALGNGSNNDTTAIQTCFDTAFGGALDIAGPSSPHGIANAHLNRAVFFPAGKYITNAPITLTDVYGARIYGSGRWTSAIFNTNTGNPNCLVTNGLSHCLISDLEIMAANTAGSIALDLNWDGNGVGLSHNLFENCEFGFESGSGVRIANAGNEGHANQFLHCSVGTNSGVGGVGWLIEGANANINQIIGGNTNTPMDYGVKCTGGSFSVQTLSMQTTAISDFYISSGKPCSIMGIRTESTIAFLIGLNGSAFVSSVSHLGLGGSTGAWAYSIAYSVNHTVISQADNYNVYKCLVAHTSAGTGTFAAERVAHPTYWAVQPVAVLANLTNFKLVMDAVVSGDYAGSSSGGKLVGDAASKFYSRGGIFLRDTAPYGTDFYTSFAGTRTAGTYVI